MGRERTWMVFGPVTTVLDQPSCHCPSQRRFRRGRCSQSPIAGLCAQGTLIAHLGAPRLCGSHCLEDPRSLVSRQESRGNRDSRETVETQHYELGTQREYAGLFVTGAVGRVLCDGIRAVKRNDRRDQHRPVREEVLVVAVRARRAPARSCPAWKSSCRHRAMSASAALWLYLWYCKLRVAQHASIGTACATERATRHAPKRTRPRRPRRAARAPGRSAPGTRCGARCSPAITPAHEVARSAASAQWNHCVGR